MFVVIEVASGEYGDKVIPNLIKSWRIRVEESRRKKSITCNEVNLNTTSNGRDSMVQVLPDYTAKTSTESIGLIEAVSQTTQV